mgnify:CR=1 FL=1
MKALIAVMPKRTVLDPQGEAVCEAIHHLGFEAVADARVGKFIELRLEGIGEAEARRRLEVICHELLSNPVIEEYSLLFERAADTRPASKKTAKKRKSKGAKVVTKAVRKPARGRKVGRKGRPGRR